ncbi:MAG: HlyD family secretion protein [Cyclobacteriaceae bacterium]|jgi:HlyD family secretion protein
MYKSLIFFSIAIGFAACSDSSQMFDASGSFEADETIISTEVAGTLLSFEVLEGQVLAAGQEVGLVDSMQLHLSRKQVLAQVAAVLSRKPDINTQLEALNAQMKAAENEQVRISNLLKSDAATPKQLDELVAQIAVLRGNIKAAKSTLYNTTNSIDMEVAPLRVQIELLDDQLSKSRLINPIAGTVIATYAARHEQVGRAKALYKIADLSELTLRAYITGDQLTQAKLNQTLTVSVDNGNGGYDAYEGLLYWVSDKAEFTPKTVQTKDERANKVYAVKIRVPNPGTLKIGMYGEVNL